MSDPDVSFVTRAAARRRTGAWAWLFAVAAASTFAGCANPCRQLADKICDCRPTTVQRDQCKAEAQLEESRVTMTPEAEELCAELLKTCTCSGLETTEGKERCGLARPRP